MKKLITSWLLLIFLASTTFAGMEEAKQLQKERKYPAAEAEFRKALPTLTGKEAAEAQFLIGEMLRLQKKHVEAIEEFQKVEKMEDALPVTLATAACNAGNSFVSMKKYEEAIKEFKKVEDIKGTSAARRALALFNIGKCYESLKKTDEAIAEYKKITLIKGVSTDQIKKTNERIEALTKTEE